MNEIIVDHDSKNIGNVGEFTFNTQELKEGRYIISKEFNDDQELFAINILHESYNHETDEPFCFSEPFEGFFEFNPLSFISTFPINKEICPFVLNNGDDNIGLLIVAFDLPAQK